MDLHHLKVTIPSPRLAHKHSDCVFEMLTCNDSSSHLNPKHTFILRYSQDQWRSMRCSHSIDTFDNPFLPKHCRCIRCTATYSIIDHDHGIRSHMNISFLPKFQVTITPSKVNFIMSWPCLVIFLFKIWLDSFTKVNQSMYITRSNRFWDKFHFIPCFVSIYRTFTYICIPYSSQTPPTIGQSLRNLQLNWKKEENSDLYKKILNQWALDDYN